MLLGTLFERFVEQAPICVAARATLEAALNPTALDGLFDRTADRQYHRELLFSTCVDLMGLVVNRSHRSIHAAYQASAAEVGVSLRSVYTKLANVEPTTSAALVRHTASRLAPVIRRMKGTLPPPLKNFHTKILDGNHLERTERRIKPLRDVAAGPLPGQTLVVLDAVLGLAIDVICCEDGHAQERSLFAEVLTRVREDDLWIADRNFCTTKFLFGLAAKTARFVIRQHASTLTWDKAGPVRQSGRCGTGKLSVQTLWLTNPDGQTLPVRRVTITLDQPTRDGETQIHLLTNLTGQEASAEQVAELYLMRWRIETVFQTLTTVLKCEVNTLGYPKAALFAFCVALAAYNVYATVKAALRGAHGTEPVEQGVSDFFLADEIAGTYRGMMIAIPAEHWQPLADADTKTLAQLLVALVRKASLPRYKKSPRGPKKPKRRRTRFATAKHIATSRLLADEKRRK
jgi:Transposase DDE domain